MLKIVVAYMFLVVGGPCAVAQTWLRPGDLGVVTDQGVFVVEAGASTTATMLLPASAFGSLSQPSIEWEWASDRFLVASGDRLYRVEVTSRAPWNATVTNLSPSRVWRDVCRRFD